MWGFAAAGKQEDESETPIQEYGITPLDFKTRCLFKDGYERSCLDNATYSLDVIPMCERHLHIRMRALMSLTLKTGKKVIISYKVRGL